MLQNNTKKRKLNGRPVAAAPSAAFDDLGTDDIANVFGFLSPKDIMIARLTKKMREAAKQTIVNNMTVRRERVLTILQPVSSLKVLYLTDNSLPGKHYQH